MISFSPCAAKGELLDQDLDPTAEIEPPRTDQLPRQAREAHAPMIRPPDAPTRRHVPRSGATLQLQGII